jgi:hypothetical protein
LRWKNYNFPIEEFRLPVSEQNGFGLSIGLGYGIDFEIDTEGLDGPDDKIIIDVLFKDLYGNPLDLYINGMSLNTIDTLLKIKYTKIILDKSSRTLESKEDGVNTWTGYYFLPFNVTKLNGSKPNDIMVIFKIRGG